MEEYLNITNGLSASSLGLLQQKLNLSQREEEARAAASSVGIASTTPTYADAAICTSEEFVGKTIALQREKINTANEAMINNMNLFLGDISNEIAGVLASSSSGGVNCCSKPGFFRWIKYRSLHHIRHLLCYCLIYLCLLCLLLFSLSILYTLDKVKNIYTLSCS